MDKSVFKNVSNKLVPKNYLSQALDVRNTRSKVFKTLLEQRKIPEKGWNDSMIEEFVNFLSSMDSNNFPNQIGVGEREARIVCSLVARRHYNFGHGIGRSGDLLEPQPKAAGGSLMSQLTNDLILDLLKNLGMKSIASCFLVPMATGMTLTLCFLTLKKHNPEAKYILWSRIDQKSCFKSMMTAGFTPIIIDTVLNENGQLCTDVTTFERHLSELPKETILCIFSTTSCFAPRNCDKLTFLARLARLHNIPHVINNAYGLQSKDITQQIEEAHLSGRIDLIVQSTDKNLMVPVGGAIIAGFDQKILKSVAKSYVGRASSSQTLDVLMTLLSVGKLKFSKYMLERKLNFIRLREEITILCAKHNEKCLETDTSISIAISLNTSTDIKNLTMLGSMLFTRGVSGSRVVTGQENKIIDGILFTGWGSHTSSYPNPYLTVAAALGITEEDVDTFCDKFDYCLSKFTNELQNKTK